MTVPLPDRLAEIEAALAKATPGPWTERQDFIDQGVPDNSKTLNGPDGSYLGTIVQSYRGEDDAALIVAAVNALPELLATVREQADAIDKVLGLHRPWYEINGVRHDHTVTAPCYEDDCACDGEGHEVPACSECRWSDGDVDGYLLWPCPTVRAVLPADHGQPTGEGR